MKLKNAWDLHFKKNNQLLFILCGSASSWIEKNIISSTGFLGRISSTLTLNELPLAACRQFWGKNIAAKTRRGQGLLFASIGKRQALTPLAFSRAAP